LLQRCHYLIDRASNRDGMRQTAVVPHSGLPIRRADMGVVQRAAAR
jgi:hypothetical protein